MVGMLLHRLLTLCLAVSAGVAAAGERQLLDSDWRFHLGEAGGAQALAFDDSRWRKLDLPHDWSIETAPSADAPSGGAGGYHGTGVGWYRRQLSVLPTVQERYRLEFEGVYQNAEVWLNGNKLGRHAYGFTPFSYDITDLLQADKPNVIAVRVDNSAQPNCRWYSGSGIYRHVWLRVLPPVHIEPSSVWVEPLPAHPWTDFYLHYTVRNTTDQRQTLLVEETLFPSQLRDFASSTHQLEIEPGQSVAAKRVHSLNPSLPWSPESPGMQRLRLRVLQAGDREAGAIDTLEQPFGLRSISVDAERGLLLNGKPLELFGGNVHHDHGPLGAASFDGAEERRVQLLKAAGFNAVRTSHNPPSEAFLDACDRFGMLVIDEAFDGWAKPKIKSDYGPQFQDLWRQELTTMVTRDRRHPCVIMWSIGNEMYERGDPSGQALARQMAEHTRRLDPTRPVTAGVNGLGKDAWDKLDPLFQPLDACGYNYEESRFAADHARKPSRVMYASESYPAAVFSGWRETTTRPYVIGDFVWSAIDYLGEAGIGRVFPPGEAPRRHWVGEHFPWRAAACGDIDLVGHRKPISYYRNIVWDRGEKLHLAVETPTPTQGAWGITPWATRPCRASWTWPVPAGTPLTVHACSRWPEVRIRLNSQEMDVHSTGEEQEYCTTFTVPYTPGDLTVEGLQNGEVMQRMTLSTAGAAAKISLKPEHDRAPADRQAVVFVNVQLEDAKGRVQPCEDRLLSFSVTGPAEIIAVGNADPTSRLPYAGKEFPTHQGKALVVLRSTGERGEATLIATADDLNAGKTTIPFTQPAG